MSAVGKLCFCIDEWQKYTDDPWILQTVAGYCLNFESEPFQISIPNEISFSEEQRKSVDFEIHELLNLGAIVHSEWEEINMFQTFLLFLNLMVDLGLLLT